MSKPLEEAHAALAEIKASSIRAERSLAEALGEWVCDEHGSTVRMCDFWSDDRCPAAPAGTHPCTWRKSRGLP